MKAAAPNPRYGMRFLVLAILGICAVPWWGCSELPTGSYVSEALISGRITDEATTGPVAGATIQMRGAESLGAQSSDQGTYALRATWIANPDRDMVTLIMLVNKAGYAAVDTSFLVLAPRTDRTIDVVLSPSAATPP